MKTKDFLSTLILALMIILICALTVFAGNSAIKVSVDSKILAFDSDPFIEKGTTMVPMRRIFEALNANVEWVKETQQIIATDHNNCIILNVGKPIAQKNGNEVVLTVAPQIVNGSTYVPVRFIAEALNADVSWDSASKTVIINSNQNQESQTVEYVDYVPYSTSNLVTLARNVLNGDVVYFNGQYWATPEFANRIANAEVVYLNDVSEGDSGANDRNALADLNFDDVYEQTEWIEENSIFLGDMTFTYSALTRNGELVRAGYFYRNSTNERVYVLWDMTKEFAEVQDAEATFNGIRIKKIRGIYSFNKADLIKNGIIKEK
jgi:hypothetical protein